MKAFGPNYTISAMNKISKSPQRHTFQKEGYVERCKEKGEEPNQNYLDLFSTWLNEDDEWSKKNHPNDMEWCLRSTDWICEKARASDAYAQNLYAAMCNNDFIKLEVVPILRQDPDKDYWSASWRSAGGIVANMRQQGDYIDWYCSGIGDGLGNGDVDGTKGYVPEGKITEEIKMDLQRLGWVAAPDGDWKKFV